MNLQFKHIKALFTYQKNLKEYLKDYNMFFVGGAIRDLLLGKISLPTDIDVTMAGDPNSIWEEINFDSEKLSRFRTEKFGTITLLPKDQEFTDVSYEITPLRKEDGYSNHRHPDEIERSDSLIDDSARRDFTINAIYRVGAEFGQEVTIKETQQCEKTRQGGLKKSGNVFLIDDGVLILQDHDIISSVFADGKCNVSELIGLMSNAPKRSSKPDQSWTGSKLSIIIDPQLGINDLEDRIIRTVGDPNKRLQEDALRVLRGARFAIMLNENLPGNTKQNNGFDFKKQTREALKHNAILINKISKERIHQEIMKVFSSDNPFGYVALLDELGLIEIIFPALFECKNYHQPTRHHAFDTYAHTLLTVHAIQQINSDPLVKLSMLYHDVGKPDQFDYMEHAKAENPENPDRSGYEHHAEIGVRLMERDFSILTFSKKQIEQIARYIKRHHRPGELLDGNEENIQKKLRKLLSDGGYEATCNLIDIAIADRLGQFNPLQPAALDQLEEMKQTIKTLFESEGRFTQSNLAISGSDIMDEFELKPGPQIGKILSKTFDRVLVDIKNRNNKEEIFQYIKGILVSLELDIQ